MVYKNTAASLECRVCWDDHISWKSFEMADPKERQLKLLKQKPRHTGTTKVLKLFFQGVYHLDHS